MVIGPLQLCIVSRLKCTKDNYLCMYTVCIAICIDRLSAHLYSDKSFSVRTRK